jgi:cell division protein FtsB
MLNRPAGPAREARRRGHNGLVLPEVLTVRLLVLAVVLLIAVVVLVPTVRAAVQQSVALHQLRNDLAASQAESDRLQRELDRWDDPAYVESQARERMHFVMPGDKVWRTIGGDTVVDDVDPVTGKPVDAGVVGTDAGKDEPWYSALWESVRVADGPATAAGSTPTPTPSPTPSASHTPSAAP